MTVCFGEAYDVAAIAEMLRCSIKTARKIYTTHIYFLPSSDYEDMEAWAGRIKASGMLKYPLTLGIGDDWLFCDPVLP